MIYRVQVQKAREAFQRELPSASHSYIAGFLCGMLMDAADRIDGLNARLRDVEGKQP